MNPRLQKLLAVYADLERGVQDLVLAQCRDTCAICSICCCRADICEEAVESPFLRALHGQEQLHSDRYGFLTESGCALDIGRPPVCYEFFCGDLMAGQPDDECRTRLRILGALPDHAGQNALPGIHLVEIMQADQLEQINFPALEKQMEEAVQALGTLRRFYGEGVLPENGSRILQNIRLPEEG
jgi:hypothetical protein